MEQMADFSSAASTIRVLIADDHALLRLGIIAVLSCDARIEVVGEAADGEQALALYKELQPDITILDLVMPGPGGIATMEAIRGHDSTARMIALTTFSGDALIRQTIRAGAHGYLLKDGIRHELNEAVISVHCGKKFFGREVAVALTSCMPDSSLSPREVEVLTLVADGYSNKRVGAALAISEDTAKAHVKNIMSKLGANDRTHAVTLAIRRGILLGKDDSTIFVPTI